MRSTEPSAREREVLALVLEEMTSAEIAHHLCVSTRTVEDVLYKLYRKLGVRGRVGAIRIVYGIGGK